MVKKPPAPTGPQPTRPLDEQGLKLWHRIQSEVFIDDAGSIEILMQICEALDRAQQLSELIKQEGCTLRTRAGHKANPMLRDEMACRAFICRGIQRLGLNLEPVKDVGRPPGYSPPTR